MGLWLRQEHGEPSCAPRDCGDGPVQPGSAWVVPDIIHVLRKVLVECPFERWASAAALYIQLCERDNGVDGSSRDDHRPRVAAEVAVNSCSAESARSHGCHSGNISGCM